MKKIVFIIYVALSSFVLHAQMPHHHHHHHHHQKEEEQLIKYVSYDSILAHLNYKNTIFWRVQLAFPEPLNFRTEIGIMFSKKHDVGIGGGVDIYPGFYNRFGGNLGVIYGKYNYYFLNKKNSPFISASIGYGWAINNNQEFQYSHFQSSIEKRTGGINTQIGIAYKIRAKYSLFAMSIGLYYNYQHYKYYEYSYSWSQYGGGPNGSQPSSHTYISNITSDNHNLILGIAIGLR